MNQTEHMTTFSQILNKFRKEALSERDKGHCFERLIQAYFREANGYLKDEQYRQAYLHFYMLLEYCFANGKTRRNGQIEKFEKSIELRLALLNTLCKRGIATVEVII